MLGVVGFAGGGPSVALRAAQYDTLGPSLAVACRESDDLRRAGIGRLEWEEAAFSLADPYASSAGSWSWLLAGRGTGC